MLLLHLHVTFLYSYTEFSRSGLVNKWEDDEIDDIIGGRLGRLILTGIGTVCIMNEPNRGTRNKFPSILSNPIGY